jgi:oxygen-independent coproporphyrinogen-3 oxidase
LDHAEPPSASALRAWPFCLSKCPYCDFNSHVARGDRRAALRARVPTEIASTAARVRPHGSSICLRRRHAVADAARDRRRDPRHHRQALDRRRDVEVTLEANPTSVEATRFRGYRAAGVNRVSLGVQALDDASLKELGRLHTAQEALDAVAIARQSFERYSFDLIYARPRQTPQQWAAELKRAIAEAAEHLSLYQLTIEPDTPFARCTSRQARHARRRHRPRALRLDAGDLRRRRAARPTRCPTTRGPAPNAGTTWCIGAAHEYAGVGPGAHGRLDIDGRRHATMAEKKPEAWLMRVETLATVSSPTTCCCAEERADEFLLMGAPSREGIDPARYTALSGRNLDPARTRNADRAWFVGMRPRRQPARHALRCLPVLDAVVGGFGRPRPKFPAAPGCFVQMRR